MRERPIIMSAPMVRAILAGTKTQTRRVAKLTGGGHVKEPSGHRRWHPADPDASRACPLGQPGDRLWVRETWARHPQDCETIFYREQVEREPGFPVWSGPWKPSIHMPRAASRITLEITGVRVERLQEISAADCWAEGIAFSPDVDPVHEYRDLWESIHRPGSWDANPWVWVIDVRRGLTAPDKGAK